MYHVPLALNLHMEAVVKELKKGMGSRGVRFQEERRECRLPGILYADNLILCGESEENLSNSGTFYWSL